MLPLHPAMRSPSPAYNLRPPTSGAREDGSQKLNIVSISRLMNESLYLRRKGGTTLASAAGDDLGSGRGSGGWGRPWLRQGQQRLGTASTPAGAAVCSTTTKTLCRGSFVETILKMPLSFEAL
jgi:hypothetical protein